MFLTAAFKISCRLCKSVLTTPYELALQYYKTNLVRYEHYTIFNFSSLSLKKLNMLTVYVGLQIDYFFTVVNLN